MTFIQIDRSYFLDSFRLVDVLRATGTWIKGLFLLSFAYGGGLFLVALAFAGSGRAAVHHTFGQGSVRRYPREMDNFDWPGFTVGHRQGRRYASVRSCLSFCGESD